MADQPLLEVRNLGLSFGSVEVLRGVDLTVNSGEVVGVVGESGSGKSTLIGAMMRTLPPPARITSGSVQLKGTDVLALSDAEVRALRWRDISLVPQSALDSLNPVMTVQRQIVDTMLAHRPDWSRAECDRRALTLLEQVGIGAEHYRVYPHELSGGLRQRVTIALAMALEPPMIVLDEPTTALDVIMESRIIHQLRTLQRQNGFSMVFVTHNLPLLLTFATRLVVLYAGQVVEEGPADAIAQNPRHPYTRALLNAIPSVTGPLEDLASIPGTPPSFEDPPPGCRFHPRCRLAQARCSAEEPRLTGDSRWRAACWFAEEGA